MSAGAVYDPEDLEAPLDVAGMKDLGERRHSEIRRHVEASAREVRDEIGRLYDVQRAGQLLRMAVRCQIAIAPAPVTRCACSACVYARAWDLTTSPSPKGVRS